MPNPVTGYIVIRTDQEGRPVAESRVFQPEEVNSALTHLAKSRECGGDNFHLAALMDF